MKLESKKNPGIKRKKEAKQINDTKRGARIPLSKVVVDKKTKQKKRPCLKEDLHQTLKNEE